MRLASMFSFSLQLFFGSHKEEDEERLNQGHDVASLVLFIYYLASPLDPIHVSEICTAIIENDRKIP